MDVKENPTRLVGTPRADLEHFLEGLGEARFRAQQVMRWIYHEGVESFDEMTNLSKELRLRLEAEASIERIRPAMVDRSTDGSAKLLFELEGNAVAEAVVIPEDDRTTLCVSSQAGCALACTFCQTAQMGAGRNLRRDEIVGQVISAIAEAGGRPITNLVFMGMGEPMLNLPEVIPAIRTLIDPLGPSIVKRRITISTAGVVPGIRELGEADLGIGLAVSLNAPEDTLRNELMPINRRYPIEELVEAAMDYQRHGSIRRVVTFEYVLLAGVNDTPQHADTLGRLLGRHRCKVNLIPHNPIDGEPYERPSGEAIDAFRRRVNEKVEVVTVRQNRGGDVAAACGQLGHRHRRQDTAASRDRQDDSK